MQQPFIDNHKDACLPFFKSAAFSREAPVTRYRIAGNFRMVQNFDLLKTSKFCHDSSTRSTEEFEIESKRDGIVLYLQPLDALPDPNGCLSSSVSPSAIKDANEAVRSATRATTPRERYAKFTASPSEISTHGISSPPCTKSPEKRLDPVTQQRIEPPRRR